MSNHRLLWHLLIVTFFSGPNSVTISGKHCSTNRHPWHCGYMYELKKHTYSRMQEAFFAIWMKHWYWYIHVTPLVWSFFNDDWSTGFFRFCLHANCGDICVRLKQFEVWLGYKVHVQQKPFARDRRIALRPLIPTNQPNSFAASRHCTLLLIKEEVSTHWLLFEIRARSFASRVEWHFH